jgi:hypothetical protein
LVQPLAATAGPLQSPSPLYQSAASGPPGAGVGFGVASVLVSVGGSVDDGDEFDAVVLPVPVFDAGLASDVDRFFRVDLGFFFAVVVP